MKLIALIPTDLRLTPFGLPSQLMHRVAGISILERTLIRVAQVAAVQEIVLVHPRGQLPLSQVDLDLIDKPVRTFEFDPPVTPDRFHAARLAGRKWSLQSWRGGLGSAACYDELLPAAPLAAAIKHHHADTVLLVGADWPLVDPSHCDQVIARHLEAADSMKMVFTQAPPGLAGIALAGSFVEHLSEKNAGFGHVLGYVPTKPQPDPIGLDVCVQIAPTVRSCARRFIYDTPRSCAMLDQVFARMHDEADAMAVCEIAAKIDLTQDFLPQQITMELTPQRHVNGPITPQHYVELSRAPMSLTVARRLVREMGDAGDIALTLGGLGDALMHPDWAEIVTTARHAGVMGIAIETDLLIEERELSALLDAPIDVLSIRLNADTAAMYERVMGADRFAQVTHNLQWLLTERQKRQRSIPWIVPRMVKTADTLQDMETFFDRWMHYAGHAVIEPAYTGRSGLLPLAPEQSPVLMSPPRRVPCRQIEKRMTILSDGSVPRCDQDWLAQDTIGDATISSLIDLWRAGRTGRQSHAMGQWNELANCAGCHEWHRP